MNMELYINGARADLDRKTKITVEYRSGILDDITKFTGSYSFSFSLPKTIVNRGILDGVEVLGHTSAVARKYNSALLLCDGVDILGGTGTAVLLSVSSDAYEVSLVFNFAPGLQEWLDKDESIQDIEILYRAWTGTADTWETVERSDRDLIQPSYRFAEVPYPAPNGLYRHPAVRERYILNQILQGIGTTAKLPSRLVTSGGIHDDGNTSCIELAVPLPTRKPMPGDETLTFSASAASLDGQRIVFSQGTSVATGGVYDYTNKRFNISAGVSAWAFNGLFVTRAIGFSASVLLQASKDGNSYETVKSYSVKSPVSNQNVYIRIDDTPDLEGYKYFYFELGSLASGISTTGIEVRATVEQVQIGGSFGTHNLPDIKQSEFLVSAMALRCAVAKISRADDGTPYLDFFYRADLYDRSRAVDWSSKLIGNLDPESVSLSLEGYARTNRYRWKENKNHDTADADGAFGIADATLERESDIYEMPEQAPAVNSYENLAEVDFYKFKTDNDGKVTFELQDCDPYLCAFGADPLSDIPESYRDEYTQYAIMTFPESLKWGNILAGPYWADFVKTLQDPVQIDVYLRLGVTDLASLDFSRPVYLEQYGQYFAIVSVRFDSSKGTSKAALLKL